MTLSLGRVQQVAPRTGFTIRKSPTEHAGGKWRLGYPSAKGGTSNLEVDVNYFLRVPLWEPEIRNSAALGEYAAKNVRVLSEAELAGGKLSALFSRVQARDLFDAHQLLTRSDLDRERLHIAFVVYGGFNRVDWRTIDLGRLDLNSVDALLGRGEIRAELLTTDPALQDKIRSHPTLNWKALNVRKHRGL